MENTSEKKSWFSSKFKIYSILIIIIISLGIYGYFWYEKTNELRQEAKIAIIKADQFEILKTKTLSEKQRCETFIAQESGDFGDFEYCQRLIQWVNSLDIDN